MRVRGCLTFGVPSALITLGSRFISCSLCAPTEPSQLPLGQDHDAKSIPVRLVPWALGGGTKSPRVLRGPSLSWPGVLCSEMGEEV